MLFVTIIFIINLFSISDTLDLHLLQVPEAMECLEHFLGTHIFELVQQGKKARLLKIITGWGQHSSNQIGSIRDKVTALLDMRLIT